MAMVPCKYQMQYTPMDNPVLISVHRHDGSVCISHGGAEMGQGLNTKIVQVVAKELRLPSLSLIATKPNYSFVSPNNNFTASSFGSELYCHVSNSIAIFFTDFNLV